MVNPAMVFDAVRRCYSELHEASNGEIEAYFDDVDADAMGGHASNIKGILFEQMYVEQLVSQGVEAELFEAINHPIVDIAIVDGSGIVNELQLKATDHVNYINTTLAEHPDVAIVATSEVANQVNSEMVIDSGIEDAVLEEAVSAHLVDEFVNPVSPLSVLGWLVGLPF
jgi:DNA-binding NarL/FixJ family response regulator